MMFKKLAQKLSLEREKKSNTAINPIDVDFDERKGIFLKNMTQNALKMYEKNCDIKNFSKLVLSNPENTSHNELVDELFKKGTTDPFEDEKLFELSNNKRFLRDLGLLDD